MVPLKRAGTLIDPPKSLPIHTGVDLDATKPADPPEAPPVDFFIFHGF